MITGATQRTSRENIFQEFGLKLLKFRRWFRRLWCMFKIMKNEARNYLVNLIPKREQTFNARNNYLKTTIAEQIVLSIHFFPVH